jgi:hypothetical protein
MRKLSIFFSFFMLYTAAVFAQCSDFTITVDGVVADGSGGYEVEFTVTSTAAYSGVDISIAWAANGAAQLTTSDLLNQSIAVGSQTFAAPVTSNLVDFVDVFGPSSGSFYLTGDFTFDNGTLNCTEAASTYPSIIWIETWGCSDPTAYNYGPNVTLDLGNCITTICPYIDITSMEIELDGNGDPVLQVIMTNSLETFALNGAYMSLTLTNTGGEIFSVDTDNIYGINMAAAGPTPGFAIVDFPITSQLSSLVGDDLVLTGYFDYTVTVNANTENCTFDLLGDTVDISRIGCTDPAAYNYDAYNVIEDSTCIDQLSIDPKVTPPPCPSSFGSSDLIISGGTPPYSTNYNGTDPDILDGGGQYVFTVTDATPASENGPIIKNIVVEVPEAPDFYVEISLAADNTTLIATVNNPIGAYYWLLDGVVIDTTYSNTYVYTEIGTYSCFVQSLTNDECYDYSNLLEMTVLDVEENLQTLQLDLYPNPASDVLMVSGIPAELELNYNIVNAVGARVTGGQLSGSNTATINTDALAEGMYYLQLANEKQVRVIPFTVIH